MSQSVTVSLCVAECHSVSEVSLRVTVYQCTLLCISTCYKASPGINGRHKTSQNVNAHSFQIFPANIRRARDPTGTSRTTAGRRSSARWSSTS